MKFLVLITLFLPIFSNATVKYFNVKTQKYISYSEMAKEIPSKSFVVMSDTHYNLDIQRTQAKLMTNLIHSKKAYSNFEFFWEFLNYKDNKRTSELTLKYIDNTLSSEAYVKELFSNKNSNSLLEELGFSFDVYLSMSMQNFISLGNESYIPLFEVVRDYNGLVLGVNATRATKQKIIKEGMKSINKKLIPPNHYVGGALYLERFTQAMGGHVPSKKIINYFEAQCFTDSVMSYQSFKNSKRDLSFIVAGSFHTDFFDGTVVRLKDISAKPVVTLRFLNVSEMTSSDILKVLTPSAKFGAVSDFVILTE